MVFFNYALRKLNAKIVYYGPGLCGKTTNLQWIHDHFEGGQRGKMISLSTEGDRTIFFDLLPLDIGEIRGMEVTLQLYTVPGQVHYNSTRQLVLRGADGVVFVADSQNTMRTSNIDSLRNLGENLSLQGVELETFPHVLQFNKRDLGDLTSIEQMDEDINKHSVPFFEAVATDGVGVQETLEGIVKLVMRSLRERYEPVVSTGPRPPGEGSVPLDVEVPPATPYELPPSVIPVTPPAQPPAMAAPPPAPIGMADDVPTDIYAGGRPPAEEEDDGGLPGAAFWNAAEQANGPTFGEDTGFGGDDPTGSENFGFTMPFADNETTTDVTDLESGEGEVAVESLDDVLAADDELGDAPEEPASDTTVSPFEVADLTPEPWTPETVFGPADVEMGAENETSDGGLSDASSDEFGEEENSSYTEDEASFDDESDGAPHEDVHVGTVDDLMASVFSAEQASPDHDDLSQEGEPVEPSPETEPEGEIDWNQPDLDDPEVADEDQPTETGDVAMEETVEPDGDFEAAPPSEIVVDEGVDGWEGAHSDGTGDESVEEWQDSADVDEDVDSVEGQDEIDAVEDVPEAEIDGAEFEAVAEVDVEVVDSVDEPDAPSAEDEVIEFEAEPEAEFQEAESIDDEEPAEHEPTAAGEWDEAHTDEIVVEEPTEEEFAVAETEEPTDEPLAAVAEVIEEPTFTEDVEEPEEIEATDDAPFTIGEGDPFGSEDDQQTPVRGGVRPPMAISAPVAEVGDGMMRAGDNQLHLRLEGTGAIAESGQVRALDIEVPVPGSWVGNRRVTLQLRLTLTPVAEEEDGGPGDAP